MGRTDRTSGFDFPYAAACPRCSHFGLRLRFKADRDAKNVHRGILWNSIELVCIAAPTPTMPAKCDWKESLDDPFTTRLYFEEEARERARMPKMRRS